MKKVLIISLFVILLVCLLTSVYFVGRGVIENQTAAVALAATGMSKAQAESEVKSIYSVCLGRTPDSGGLKNYSEKLMNGESVNKVKSDICNSPEAQKYNNSSKNTSGNNSTSNAKSSYEQQIATVYRVCLKREPDAGGLKTYVNMLENGKSINDVTKAVCSSPEAVKVGTTQYDISAVNNLFKDGNKQISKDDLLKIGLISGIPVASTVSAASIPLGIIAGSSYIVKKVFGW